MKFLKMGEKARILAILLALLMIVMESTPFLQVVNAADPGGASEGRVSYYHPNQGAVKYVHPWNGDNAAPWLGGIEPDAGKQYVYCVNPTRNALDKESWNQHFRWRYNLNVNKWLIRTNNDQLTNPIPNIDVDDMYEKIKKVLYVGFPYNKGAGTAGTYNYYDTQDAIEALVTGTGAKQNALYNEALAYTGNINGNLYFYAPDTETKQVAQNTIGLALWDNKTKDAGTLKTTVKAGKAEGKENAPARITGDEAAAITSVTDKIDYSGLTAGATYTVSGTLMDVTDASDMKEVAKASEEKKAEAADGTWEITFNNVKLEAGHKYVVFEEAVNKDNPEDKAEHKDAGDLAQTVVVGGKLKTTVSAGGKTGSADKAATLTAAEADKVTSVTDKIDYEGLTAGATYKVSGTLHDVTDNKDVATATEEKKAEKADGTWEITFSNVKLQAGHKYVVYEEAVNKDDAKDKAEHKDDKDLAQTIVVEPEENKGKDDEKKEDSDAGNDAAILSVSKTSDVDEAGVGDEVPFTITVNNTGKGDATGVKVRDIMGDHLEYVSDDSDGVHSGKNVDWTIDVPAGDSVEIEITCKIKASASGKIVNNVKIMNPDIFGSVTEDADKALVNLDGGDSDDTDNNNADDEDISGGDGDDTGSSDGVRTGDENSVMLWMAIALAALVMLAAAKKRLNK